MLLTLEREESGLLCHKRRRFGLLLLGRGCRGYLGL
jgi:hypothetical protein